MIHSAVVPCTDFATLLTSVRSSRESAAKKIQRGATDALGVASLAPCFLRLAPNALGTRPINVTGSPGFTPSLAISDLGLAIFSCHFSALGPRRNVNRSSFVRTCNSPSSTRTSLTDENGILNRALSPRKIISEVSRRARPVEGLPLCVTVQLTSFPIVHPAKHNSASPRRPPMAAHTTSRMDLFRVPAQSLARARDRDTQSCRPEAASACP